MFKGVGKDVLNVLWMMIEWVNLEYWIDIEQVNAVVVVIKVGMLEEVVWEWYFNVGFDDVKDWVVKNVVWCEDLIFECIMWGLIDVFVFEQ